MYANIEFYQFNDWFEKHRPDNFSSEGRFALFNYLEELENETGDKIKFDPIAFCCEYSEYDNFKKIQENYDDWVLKYINENDLSSALCDAYDIKDRLRAYDIKDKPKDADGSDITVGDCIDDIVNFLEQLENDAITPAEEFANIINGKVNFK